MARVNGVGRRRGYYPLDDGTWVYVHVYQSQWWWRIMDGDRRRAVGNRIGPFTDSDAAFADASRLVE